MSERAIPSIHGNDHLVGGPDPVPSLAMWPVKVGRDNLQVQEGDNRFVWEIPEDLDGHVLMKVIAWVFTTGTGVTEVMIRDVDTDIDMLSTSITIDSGERSSRTAATPSVVNPTYAEVAEGQQLAIDVDSAAFGATGLGVYFYFLATVAAVQSVTGPAGTDGADGTDGTDGTDGADGLGVPSGGTTGQVLTKLSGADNDTDWETPTASPDAVDVSVADSGSLFIATDVEGALAELAEAKDTVAATFGAPDTAFEFDTSSLSGLSAVGTADVENADTTVPGHYYLRDDDGAWVGRYLSASAPFTAITKLTDATRIATDGNKIGLFVGDSSPALSGDADVILVGNSTYGIWVELANTSNIYSEGVGGMMFPVYLAIRVNSSSDVDYLWSPSGLIWKKVVDSRNPGIGTIATAGIALTFGSTGGGAWDYLRIWNSAKSFPGALA